MRGAEVVSSYQKNQDYPWSLSYREICVLHRGVRIHVIEKRWTNSQTGEKKLEIKIKGCRGKCNYITLSHESEQAVEEYVRAKGKK